MCFNQRGDTLNIKWRFFETTYLGTGVSSTKNDINAQLAKAWKANDSRLIIWKSDVPDKIKRIFFSKQQSCQYCYIDAPRGRTLSVWRKSLTTIT